MIQISHNRTNGGIIMKTTRRRFIKGFLIGSAVPLAGRPIFAVESEDTIPENVDALFEVFKHRRSVRKFKSTPIPEAHLNKILEAANYAPTPRNRQAWKFVVIRDRAIIDEIKEACIKRSGERTRDYYTDYLSAPVYVVVLADKTTRNPVNDITAGALAAENLLLAARALGYGTVYCVNSIPEDITNPILNVPEKYQRVLITPIGIPDAWPEMPEKKDVGEAVVHDRFE